MGHIPNWVRGKEKIPHPRNISKTINWSLPSYPGSSAEDSTQLRMHSASQSGISPRKAVSRRCGVSPDAPPTIHQMTFSWLVCNPGADRLWTWCTFQERSPIQIKCRASRLPRALMFLCVVIQSAKRVAQWNWVDVANPVIKGHAGDPFAEVGLAPHPQLNGIACRRGCSCARRSGYASDLLDVEIYLAYFAYEWSTPL